MKSLVKSILVATTIATKTPNKEVNYNTHIEKRIQDNKVIGIKKKHVTKHASKFNLENAVKMQVGATAYCGDTITSTGVKPIEGITIAVDPKVIPYGTKVYIPQFNKVFIAQDCGSAIKGNRIDIFMNDYNQAMEWGYKSITIYILNE